LSGWSGYVSSGLRTGFKSSIYGCYPRAASQCMDTVTERNARQLPQPSAERDVVPTGHTHGARGLADANVIFGALAGVSLDPMFRRPQLCQSSPHPARPRYPPPSPRVPHQPPPAHATVRHPHPPPSATHTSHPPAAHSTYHPASTLTSTCHPRGTAICLFYPGTGSALGVKSRRPASWNGAAATGTRVPGRRAAGPGRHRSGDWPTGLLHQSGGAQQFNAYRTTARRQHLAQGPERQGLGDDGSGDGWRRDWPPGGWGVAAPWLGEDGGGAARAGPGRQAGRGRGQGLAEEPGRQAGRARLAEGWRGWRGGRLGATERSGDRAAEPWGDRAAEPWGDRAAERLGGGAVGRPGGGAVGRRSGWGRWAKWLRCGAR
jgi:hypothetical protein